MVNIVPSDPVTVSWVVLLAVTVKVDELPAGIEAGLAEIDTVGAAVVPKKLFTPHPVKSMGNDRPRITR